jgi:hypothetical protein
LWLRRCAGAAASLHKRALLRVPARVPRPRHQQDEISTGLDSSTTYLIVRCIRNYVHLLDVSGSPQRLVFAARAPRRLPPDMRRCVPFGAAAPRRRR